MLHARCVVAHVSEENLWSTFEIHRWPTALEVEDAQLLPMEMWKV